ncbi:hypothetical protein NOJ28_08950 [Neorhizobium galegae]|uniref:hypothetical protein n=1 Tax=Neorhizobium galegae TaxID=399 RepID=UPI000621E70B|nr:hypothetical protein [Neorhizobium galegae]MCQ1765655.1 hypothetical protein [Neorhizobium galegae]MCQ1844569.1 hypothetical protein [Neorhizobium galegae]CDZ32812.1 Hypothetical protein NGAL_HAMBI1146_00510 [Neorhizobium galegae bv. officinalis]
MKCIPENLSLLHSGEEDLRAKSIALIQASEDTTLHVSMIETCMDMLQYVRMNTPDMSEDQVIVALVGASVFNSIASAFKLLLGGYYQSSGLQIRYVMESGWLLDYLRTDPKLVQEWKATPEDKRQKKFGPGFIRDELDKRDGFTAKKRAEHYKRLCVLCGHPTFAGFAMLRPQPNADAHMGPFLVPDLLEGCIQELVQVSITAWQSFMRFFPAKTVPDYKARISYMEKQNVWLKHVYGKPDDMTAVDELKKLIVRLEAQSI